MELSTLARRFVGGRCASDRLPKSISLRGIRRTMKRLWRASIHDIGAGIVVEHAATLVLQANGKVSLRYEVAGTPDVVNPVYNVAPDETFIGTYHTHPFEDGLTGMPFSSQDIASVINDAEWISLAQSGDDVFALIRTDKAIDSVTLSEVEGQVDRLYVALQTQHSLSAPDALWIANLHACSLYGFAFYAGQVDGQLEEVFTP